jgi:hypothetical protein
MAARSMSPWVHRCIGLLGLLSALLLGPFSCAAQPPPGARLIEVIDDAGKKLISSGEASTVAEFEAPAKPPWFVILIPRNGFDAGAAADAGIEESLRRRIDEKCRYWRKKGKVTVVVSTAGGLALGGVGILADVEIAKQQIVKGDSSRIELTLKVARADGHALITDVAARRPHGPMFP